VAAAMCAADEVAVDAFLKGAIRFTDIPSVVSQVMESAGARPGPAPSSLEEIICAEEEAKRRASEVVGRLLAP